MDSDVKQNWINKENLTRLSTKQFLLFCVGLVWPNENAWICSCDFPTNSGVDQAVKICRAMAAESYDIETKRPAVITRN